MYASFHRLERILHLLLPLESCIYLPGDFVVWDRAERDFAKSSR